MTVDTESAGSPPSLFLDYQAEPIAVLWPSCHASRTAADSGSTPAAWSLQTIGGHEGASELRVRRVSAIAQWPSSSVDGINDGPSHADVKPNAYGLPASQSASKMSAAWTRWKHRSSNFQATLERTRVNIDPSLLVTFEERASAPDALHACINAHGLYNRVQFVLRLSPEVHRKLSGLSLQLVNPSQVTFEQVQAFSTLLHETIHWWQHIGSTAGLMLSLSRPVQSHINFPHLRTFIHEVGPKKSVLKFAKEVVPVRQSAAALQATNIIVNNHNDVSFFEIIATCPDLIRKNRIGDDPLFECVGHSYYITYANTVHLLAEVFDPQFAFLPDVRKWEPMFAALRAKRQEGYYRGSPIRIPPVGLFEIFEGQARFTQLQYLHFSTSGKFDWDDAGAAGMLGPEYVACFKMFLALTESDWPNSIDSPVVALFMAVCDMAMNGGEGFPFSLRFPPAFISDNDPGMRFAFFCRMVTLEAPYLRSAIRNYSRREYLETTERLCGLLHTPTPLKVARAVTAWSNDKPTLISLMEEDRNFRFSAANMPLRLLFARYLTYNRDKARHPEVLCWPGAWLAGDRASSVGVEVFGRNQAMFVDKEDDDGVFPIDLPGRDADIVNETFNLFYAWIVNYDLILQWTVQEGPFRYPYRWLSTAQGLKEMKEWAANGFSQVFGEHPDRFEIL